MFVQNIQRLSLFLSFTLCSIVISCTPKATKTSVGLKISTKGVQALSSFPTNRRICFGVDVSARDMEFKEQSTCEPKRSLHKGFIENGGVLDVEVPVGKKRQFDLYAYLLPEDDATSACPDWDSSLNYSHVYKVGGTTEPIDLEGAEVILEITLNFPGIDNNIKRQLDLVDCPTVAPDLGFKNVTITSSHTTSTLAKVGDVITLSFETEMPIDDVTARVFGQLATITNVSENTYQAVYTLTGSEPDGLVSFSLEHSSGNATVTHDSTSVSFDKTAPTAPTSVAITSPTTSSIGTGNTPSFQISGTEDGATVELHANASCSSLAGTSIASGSSAVITTPPLTADVTRQFYARQIDAVGNVSACSTTTPAIYRVYSAKQPFVSTWQLGAPDSITLPLRAGYNYNFVVDWGDGSANIITNDSDPDRVHNYTNAGTYTITLSGTAETLYFNDTGDKNKIYTVANLGDMGWTSFEKMFFGCTNLTTVAGGNTLNVTSMRQMFEGATNAVPDTSGWNTTNVTTMLRMFMNASNANPDVSNWNTANVSTMQQMFHSALNATPDVSSWDTSSVTNMSSLFYNATSANPDVSSWDTSGVVNMSFMFMGASAANPNTATWDTSSVTNMTSLFFNSGADPVVTNWDTSSVTTMNSMFGSIDSDPNVSGWVTSSVLNMSQMFSNNNTADPDVSSWDTSSVTDMNGMFNAAPNADPDMSTWNLSMVGDMDQMFTGSLSMIHYSNLLTNLASQTLQLNVTLDVGGTTHNGAGGTAKSSIIAGYSWTINDGGP